MKTFYQYSDPYAAKFERHLIGYMERGEVPRVPYRIYPIDIGGTDNEYGFVIHHFTKHTFELVYLEVAIPFTHTPDLSHQYKLWTLFHELGHVVNRDYEQKHPVSLKEYNADEFAEWMFQKEGVEFTDGIDKRRAKFHKLYYREEIIRDVYQGLVGSEKLNSKIIDDVFDGDIEILSFYLAGSKGGYKRICLRNEIKEQLGMKVTFLDRFQERTSKILYHFGLEIG